MRGSNLAGGRRAQLSARLSVVGVQQLPLVVVRIVVNRTKAAIPCAVKRVRRIEKIQRKEQGRSGQMHGKRDFRRDETQIIASCVSLKRESEVTCSIGVQMLCIEEDLVEL